MGGRDTTLSNEDDGAQADDEDVGAQTDDDMEADEVPTYTGKGKGKAAQQ